MVKSKNRLDLVGVPDFDRPYLTENGLGRILAEVYGPGNVYREVYIADGNVRTRADYVVANTAFFFDGWRHYVLRSVCRKDKTIDKALKSLGFRVVRIPYYIQPTADVSAQLFGVHEDFSRGWRSGFWARPIFYPIDFCWCGISRFVNDLKQFRSEKENILASLDAQTLDFIKDLI